ncbi:hypothetical protein [Pseudoalteromonas sp. SR41-4]|uniref:hypothetical protein n=1 Tax=Pseudoalteromonas sp. SR41-4 TaxID=2760950 RepID=UPI0016018A2C|nr:hypothetical protein [Pseudoalteromonas sp. SR41-4]MBB1292235.1 hypothetical protein [Pseudoalteromonas sp. SR41-4]
MNEINTPNIEVQCKADNYFSVKTLTVLPHTQENWLTFFNSETNPTESLSVLFNNAKNNDAKSIEKKQYVELIISLDPSVAADWEFYGNGVEYCGADSNCQYNISTEITDGNTLVLTIAQVEPTYEFLGVDKDNLEKVVEVTEGKETEYLPISFRYTAKHVPSGKIYMSQDPKIIVRRPGATL